METQLLFYKNAVPLSNEVHRDVSVRPVGGLGFARKVNAVPLVAAEFRAAAADMPIVFAGQGESLIPVAVMGLKDGENLFIDDQDRWTGAYVPAFLRRYPFVFASEPDQERLPLCIDEAYEGVNRDGAGERLFDSEGNQSLYMGKVLEFMRDYQVQFNTTRQLCEELERHQMLEPMHADYTLPSGTAGRLSGFSVISRDKLKALPGDMLERLMKSDALETAFVHLHSLNNLRPLLQKMGSPAPEAAPADA